MQDLVDLDDFEKEDLEDEDLLGGDGDDNDEEDENGGDRDEWNWGSELGNDVGMDTEPRRMMDTSDIEGINTYL